MRHLLADAAYWLAYRSLRKAERAGSVAWKTRWLRRSEFWSDAEAWLAGLGSWKQLRSRRRARRAVSRRVTRAMLKPVTGRVGPNAGY